MDIGGIIFFGVLVGVPAFISIIIFAAIFSYLFDEKKKQQKHLEEKERLRRILVSEFPVEKYTPTKIYKDLISFDFNNKKWRPEIFENCKPYGFDEIAKFELVENNSVTVYSLTNNSGAVAGAVFGEMLAGDTGAVVGALSAPSRTFSNINAEVTSRAIRISLSNRDVNQIIIDIPLKKTIDVTNDDSNTYKLDSKAAAGEIISTLEGAVAVAKRDAQKKLDNDKVIQEIRKFKALYDEGILTEEEFTKKKQQLLNI